MKTKQISFKATKEEHGLIGQIVDRIMASHKGLNRIDLIMDLTACHANGCPLDLHKLAKADNFNLVHDVFGIARHIDRETGQLQDCFVPRYAL